MLGIATEIDTDEAFAPLNTLLFWYLCLLGLLVISMIAGLFLRLIRKGSSKPSIPLSKKYLVLAPNEVIGKNIKMLMPEPYFSEHDGYLESYLRTGKKEIINMVREVQGLHKNGSTFPMDLRVSESTEGDKKIFVGDLREIFMLASPANCP